MQDVGIRLIESLFSQLMVDEDWSVRRERGFTWWSYRLAQHVEVSEPFESGGLSVCSVRIWTEMVNNVDPAVNPVEIVRPFNMQSTLSALVWDEDAGTISECSTAIVHDGIFEWLSRVLATAAIVQNAGAHNRARGFAEMTRGVPAASAHPSNGQRPESDDILNVPQGIVLEGQEPSRFAGSKMEGIGQFLVQMNFFGSADDTGLTCEVPFTGVAPAVTLSADRGDQLQTSLVQVFTDTPHPDAGNGVLMVVRLPISPDIADALAISNALNRAEAQGGSLAHLLGAWCADPTTTDGRTVAYCCFVPNTLARWVRIENLVLNASMHSRFAAQFLNV